MYEIKLIIILGKKKIRKQMVATQQEKEVKNDELHINIKLCINIYSMWGEQKENRVCIYECK